MFWLSAGGNLRVMAVTTKEDIADFPAQERRRNADTPQQASDSGRQSLAVSANAIPGHQLAGIWVLCRRGDSGDVETVRAFDDEARARADLELAECVSNDEFWLAAVPMVETGSNVSEPDALSPVQVLALSWLVQGAEAEAIAPVEEPVVVSPRHVRGFVSVPPHEWRDLEERGLVSDGLITPEGAARVGRR